MKTPEKKGKMTPEHKAFLDELKESGIVNMFGAGAYLQAEFGTNPQETREIMLEWLYTFKKDE